MPQINTVTLAGTGSNSYAFDPVAASNGKAVLANRSSGVPRFSPRIEIALVEPKSATGAYRVVGSLILPKTKTVDGELTLARQNRINFDANFAPDSNAAERRDDMKVFEHLIASSLLDAVAGDLSSIY